MSRYLDEQLIAARQEIVEAEEYLPLSLANEQFINIVNEIPQGIFTWKFATYSRLGQAAIILNRATGVPVTNRTVSEQLVTVYPIRAGFNVTRQDIETAQALNRNIISEFMQDAKDAIDQKLDIVSYTGDTGTSLTGLANVPNVARINFPADGTGSSAAWSTKTAAQLLRDMNLIASKIPEQTGLTKFPDRIIMPATKYTVLQTTPYSTMTGESVLSIFMKNQAGMGAGGIKEIIGHPVLETLGTGGVGLMLAYNSKSNNNRLHIPRGGDFRDMDYSLTGTTWTVPCEMYTAGIEIKKTLEVCYANVS